MNLKTNIMRFLKDESGQTTTEYILILAVVVMVAMKFRTAFQGQLTGIVEKLGGDIGKFQDTSN